MVIVTIDVYGCAMRLGKNLFLPVLLSTVLVACSSSTGSKISVDYYSINGKSTAELDRQIRQKGPRINGGKHAVAVARIRMIPDLKFKPSHLGSPRESCTITSAKVSVDAKVTLPRWAGRAKASAKLGEAWDNIEKYTRLHEATHVNIALFQAKKMEEALSGLSSKGNCTVLRLKARDIVREALKVHDKVQRKFDADEQRRFAQTAESLRRLKASTTPKS